MLPPFDVLVSTPSPWLQVALHVANYAARLDEVLVGASSSGSYALIRSTSGAETGHWLQATPILPSLRFLAPLFVTALRLRLGLPHLCLATYAACACGHPLDPLGTHLLRYARGGERTTSHDSLRDAIYHIIREFRQHAHRERTGFLPSSVSRGRGGRVDIVTSLCEISPLPQMQSEGRKPTIEISQRGRNLCPLLLRRMVHCLIGRIDFWSSVQRYHLESVQDQGPPLACCAHGSVTECRLH